MPKKVEAWINEAPTTVEGSEALYEEIIAQVALWCLTRGLDVTTVEPELFRKIVQASAAFGMAAVIA